MTPKEKDIQHRDFDMTDRYYALTVILEKDMRSDDSESLINAIKSMRNVLEVKPHITDISSCMAEERALYNLRSKILDCLI